MNTVLYPSFGIILAIPANISIFMVYFSDFVTGA